MKSINNKRTENDVQWINYNYNNYYLTFPMMQEPSQPVS